MQDTTNTTRERIRNLLENWGGGNDCKYLLKAIRRRWCKEKRQVAVVVIAGDFSFSSRQFALTESGYHRRRSYECHTHLISLDQPYPGDLYSWHFSVLRISHFCKPHTPKWWAGLILRCSCGYKRQL